eukprot:Opistho-1_new@15142
MRQAPGPEGRHVPAGLDAAGGQHARFRTDGPADQRVRPGRLGLFHLVDQRLGADGEAHHDGRLDAELGEGRFQIHQAGVAVARLVDQQRRSAEAALGDLGRQELRLQRIARRGAEDEALARRVLGGQHRPGRARHEQHVPVLLEHVERLGRHAGVAEADRGEHLLLQHQVLGRLHAGLGVGLVIAHHQFERAAQVAADLVHLFDRDLCADAGTVAHVRRPTCEREDQADADRIVLRLGMGTAGSQRQHGAERQRHHGGKRIFHGLQRLRPRGPPRQARGAACGVRSWRRQNLLAPCTLR